MADTYISYIEVDEYATHFLSTAAGLVGASPLLDMQWLLDHVKGRYEQVNAELEKAGVKRSALQDGAGERESGVQDAREELSRFWNYLGSLDKDVKVNKGAFFEGEKLGPVAALKAADLKGKLNRALDGFSADANKNLPDAGKWQGKLAAARDALGQAADTVGEARGESIQATVALQAAREAFLRAYNGVAKRMVLGLLTLLGREGEYASFFKDLQVNERAKPKAAEGTEGKGTP